MKTAHPLIMRVPRLSAATAALSSGTSPPLFFQRVLCHMEGAVSMTRLQSRPTGNLAVFRIRNVGC